MSKLKIFSKEESVALIAIFLVFVAVAVPNFAASLRRARDQVRRDDLGALESSLSSYASENNNFPLSSSDGKVLDCLKPGDKPYQNSKGIWIVNPISCNWGQDSFSNLFSGKIYMSTLPLDPDSQKGAAYLYLSDGKRYQIFIAMEGKNEAEVDPKIIERQLNCGNRICNAGRSSGCEVFKTLQQCEKEALNVKK